MEQKKEEQKNPLREQIEKILAAVMPDVDFTDDFNFYNRVYDDYENYAATIENLEECRKRLAAVPATKEEYDRAIEAARADGRRQALDEIEKSEAATAKGDGVPMLAGANNVSRKRRLSIFDLASLG